MEDDNKIKCPFHKDRWYDEKEKCFHQIMDDGEEITYTFENFAGEKLLRIKHKNGEEEWYNEKMILKRRKFEDEREILLDDKGNITAWKSPRAKINFFIDPCGPCGFN